CAFLSMQYRRMWRAMAKTHVSLNAILDTLTAKRIAFVLTGMYGISSWTGKPRATHDVDILVRSGRTCVRAVNALRALFPDLEVRDFFGVSAFFVPGETHSVIHVTYPHRTDLAETLETAIWVTEGKRKYRIPTLECALANKYGASLAVNRDPGKRAQDMVDFYSMVKHSTDEGRRPIDLDRLAELGEMVWPGGGGKELLLFVEQAKAGIVPNPSNSQQPQ